MSGDKQCRNKYYKIGRENRTQKRCHQNYHEILKTVHVSQFAVYYEDSDKSQKEFPRVADVHLVFDIKFFNIDF